MKRFSALLLCSFAFLVACSCSAGGGAKESTLPPLDSFEWNQGPQWAEELFDINTAGQHPGESPMHTIYYDEMTAEQKDGFGLSICGVDFDQMRLRYSDGELVNVQYRVESSRWERFEDFTQAVNVYQQAAAEHYQDWEYSVDSDSSDKSAWICPENGSYPGLIIRTEVAGDGDDAAFLVDIIYSFSQAGTLYNDIDPTELGDEETVASYKGIPITKAEVEYNRDLNNVEGKGDGDAKAAVDRIITGMILLEEAEKKGLLATPDEIQEMVDSVKRSYEIPDGKQIIDDYCESVGITLDEYIALIEGQAPETIARQKLRNQFDQEYCEKNSIEYGSFSQETYAEITKAYQTYRDELLEKSKEDIVYNIEYFTTAKK